MHLSLCDQMAEFVNLCPLGQDRKLQNDQWRFQMAI